ncbi:MAG: TlpA disulfide reductase family protein [Daejeonella sp.]|uniref:TlpA family protein disulfide reductase n=1 Tax=Daejeonella sp. TaxID=2805397 RepID=UPI003C71B030
MKSKIFSKAGLFAAIFILIAGVLLISPDAKALLFGSKNININRSADPVQSSTSTQSVNNGPESPAEFPLAPSVVFKDGNGTTIDISKQQGKVLFINFWATWCPPCIQEMPSINKLKKQFDEKDIMFLMVDVDDNYKRSSKFMANNKYDLTVYTQASEIPKEFLSGSIPTTVIIDKEGKVVGHHEGGADYMNPEIVQFFKQLISK